VPLLSIEAMNASLDGDYGTTRGPTPLTATSWRSSTTTPRSPTFPTDVELSGGGYARVTVNPADWAAAAAGAKSDHRAVAARRRPTSGTTPPPTSGSRRRRQLVGLRSARHPARGHRRRPRAAGHPNRVLRRRRLNDRRLRTQDAEQPDRLRGDPPPRPVAPQHRQARADVRARHRRSAGTEVTGGSYARQTLTFAAAASGSKSDQRRPVVHGHADDRRAGLGRLRQHRHQPEVVRRVQPGPRHRRRPPATRSPRPPTAWPTPRRSSSRPATARRADRQHHLLRPRLHDEHVQGRGDERRHRHRHHRRHGEVVVGLVRSVTAGSNFDVASGAIVCTLS
jgi:hypothetical protein